LEAGLGDSPSETASQAEDNPERRLPTGFRIGPYQIEKFLGAGGMGHVYQVADTRLGRKVAMKFLSAAVADAAGRRRFQREAQLASSLNHPHILMVHDVGEFEGRQFLVTEFVDGGTLSDWARRQTRTPREFADLLAGVADGLAAAHAASILHRDIKPANVLVTRSGYAKLADFGLARLAETGAEDASPASTQTITRPGVIVGTIAYMSPEQLAGRPADERSDIFSFGVLLYELLAGHRPFTATTDLELQQNVVHGTPQPLDECIPTMLRLIVEKALEKDPSDRYQSMRELVVDLRRFTKMRPVGGSVAVQSKPRVWLPWSLTGVVLVAAAAWEVIRPAAPPLNPLEGAHFTRVTDFESTEGAISPDGRFVAFVSDHAGPFDVWLTQLGTGRQVNLTQGKVAQLPGPLRSVGFSGDSSEVVLGGGDVGMRVRLIPLTGGEPRNFLGEEAANVAWSPDGSRIVYHTFGDGDPIFVADRTGANPRRIAGDRSGIHNHFPTWSPDGRWIYFVHGMPAIGEMDLWRIKPAGGAPERLTERNTDVAYPTPLGSRTVLYVAHDTDGSGPWLWAFDLKHKHSSRLSVGLEHYTSVGASADGRKLVATIGNPQANLWSVPILDRLAEEPDVKPFPVPTVRALAPRFQGAALFYLSSLGTGDGLWRYRGGEAIEVWKGAEEALVEAPAVAPDGSRVGIVLRRNGKRQLHVLSADGAELQALASAIDAEGTACWSPDGKWIVTGGSDANGPGLFKIPLAGGSPSRLAAGVALDPVWSPDGSLIVYAGANIRTFAPLLAVRPDGTSVRLPDMSVRRQGARVRFLPGGKGLVYTQGLLVSQDFWLLDLITMRSRRLTRLENRAAMRTFDITPDGKQIVFDRLRENSDVVLIDLPKESFRLAGSAEDLAR
jgi:Tol biopolymer transport system component